MSQEEKTVTVKVGSAILSASYTVTDDSLVLNSPEFGKASTRLNGRAPEIAATQLLESLFKKITYDIGTKPPHTS